MLIPLSANHMLAFSTPPLGTHSTGLLLQVAQTVAATPLFDVVPTYSF